MNIKKLKEEKGSIGGGLILWVIGAPLPIILLVMMMKSC